METKNTPLLFQQELNTFYKDILNCEITHPSYWAGRVPETFFLRKRKWIDIYQDWGWDEVLDYIQFDWKEYAIVRYNQKIQIKKWINDVDTSDVSKATNIGRTLRPGFWWFGENWSIWDFKIDCFTLRDDWHKLYIYTVAPYTVDWETTTQLFVTEYTLNIKNNISTDYATVWKTYRVQALDWLFEASDWARCAMSVTGKSLFVFINSKQKFYQIPLDVEFDISTLWNEYLSTDVDLSSITEIKDLKVTPYTDKLIFVAWDTKVYSISFPYNSIDRATTLVEKDFEWTYVFNWLVLTSNWKRMYLASAGFIYQFDTTWDAYDITNFSYSNHNIEVWTVWSSTINDALTLELTADDCSFLIAKNNTSLSEFPYYIAQAWFEHSKKLIEQNYNKDLNHSFKRNFQSAKWQLLFGWTITTDQQTWERSITDKVDWSVTNAIYKLTPTTAPSWTANQYAGKYVMLFWWWTSNDTWTSQWCALPISANDTTTLTVSMWWDAMPKKTTYWIFDWYWEVLVFVWGDWLYAIHNDDFIWRYESINKKRSVVDADWSNWMIYTILDNWEIYMSASKTNDWNYPLSWWNFAWYMNGSSYLWSISWAMRIVPFNDIVVIFTNNWIYVIKKEAMDILWTTINTFTVDLAFGFLWLHSFNAVCPYNTWIYFLSNKNTFLSLNIEESYYNKYKITTEDLWIDIQQWLDNIKKDDPVSIWINTETIYMTWYGWDQSTIFQYSNYYSFWHRWETKLMIKKEVVDTNETYLWAVWFRYNILWLKTDEWMHEYKQHLRWFNGDTDIFSLKTILYHDLYMWVNTDVSTVVKYKARLSSWLYEYIIPLSNASYLQKASNLTAEKVLGNSILWYQTLWWNAEKYIIWTYLADVDVLEIPLWLTYSLLEIIVEWDFETWGNLLWTLVHEPHLTPYEDVVAYLDE